MQISIPGPGDGNGAPAPCQSPNDRPTASPKSEAIGQRGSGNLCCVDRKLKKLFEDFIQKSDIRYCDIAILRWLSCSLQLSQTMGALFCLKRLRPFKFQCNFQNVVKRSPWNRAVRSTFPAVSRSAHRGPWHVGRDPPHKKCVLVHPSAGPRAAGNLDW